MLVPDLFLGPEASTFIPINQKRRGNTPPDDPPPPRRVRLTEPRTPLESGRQCNWCQRCLWRLSILTAGQVVECLIVGARTRCGTCARGGRTAAQCLVVCSIRLACDSLIYGRFLRNCKPRQHPSSPSMRDFVRTLVPRLFRWCVTPRAIWSTSFRRQVVVLVGGGRIPLWVFFLQPQHHCPRRQWPELLAPWRRSSRCLQRSRAFRTLLMRMTPAMMTRVSDLCIVEVRPYLFGTGFRFARSYTAALRFYSFLPCESHASSPRRV